MDEQDGPAQKDSGLSLRTANRAMNPDHPMLRRAQQVLARQLNDKRMRVEGELREKQTALQVIKESSGLLHQHAAPPIDGKNHAVDAIWAHYRSSDSLPSIQSSAAALLLVLLLASHSVFVCVSAACQEAAGRGWCGAVRLPAEPGKAADVAGEGTGQVPVLERVTSAGGCVASTGLDIAAWR